MPQLDKLTFFTQIVWLVVVFFSLYLFFSSFVLPKVGMAMKFRSELFLEMEEDFEEFKYEEWWTINFHNCNMSDVSYWSVKSLQQFLGYVVRLSNLFLLSSRVSGRMQNVNKFFFGEIASVQLRRAMVKVL